MPKIEFIGDEEPVVASTVDLTVDGWVVAFVTESIENNHRYIPRDRVRQIISTDSDNVEEPEK